MTDLLCKNIFCVYWDNHECILKNIVLNAQGCCPDYTPIPVDKETLSRVRSHPPTRSISYLK